MLAGLFLMGLALVAEGASATFANLLAVQFVLGLGYALNNGAQEAWIADELAGGPLPAGTPIPAGGPLADIGPAPGGEPADTDDGRGGQPAIGGAGPGDEPGDHEMTGVYLRATQLGLVATVAGSLLSGPIAAGGLNLPLITGGTLICVLAAVTALVMPERHFRRPAAAASIRTLTRESTGLLAAQTRAAHRAIVAVPGLVLLFGMTFFAGMWSESFDRLWGALLIRDIGIPKLAGLSPAIWFSLLAAVVAVLALGSTEVARRRAARLGADSVASAVLALTVAIGIGVVAMATTHSFAAAVAAYLLIEVLRPVISPLIDGWMVARIDPSVRATALSAGTCSTRGARSSAGRSSGSSARWRRSGSRCSRAPRRLPPLSPAWRRPAGGSGRGRPGPAP